MLNPLVVRTDGSPDIGTGHVMRCLALAQAWQARGGEVRFLMNASTEALRERLRREDIKVHSIEGEMGGDKDARETERFARQSGARWIVVDGYHFGGSYQKRLGKEGRKVLFIDDYGHADFYAADLVLNQNISADRTLHQNRSDETQLLLGPKYALLREEFWPWREERCEPRQETRHVLITLGGSDPDNVTEKVVRSLDRLSVGPLEVTLVVGGSNPNTERIEAAVEDVQHFIRLLYNVSSMAELMAEADIAISGGGSTCWELAFMGIPNVILVLADNQRGIAEGLEKTGTALNLGWHMKVAKEEIADQLEKLLGNDQQYVQMARKAQELVDGWGSERVLGEMISQKAQRHHTLNRRRSR